MSLSHSLAHRTEIDMEPSAVCQSADEGVPWVSWDRITPSSLDVHRSPKRRLEGSVLEVRGRSFNTVYCKALGLRWSWRVSGMAGLRDRAGDVMVG